MEENLGIIDIEIYFPKYYISQYDLEEYDKVPHGKYTLGLGQTNMSFVDDNEDINSMCLTVLDKLIKKNNISLSQISRIEVGTETLIDKSKSIKTHLMDLFKDSSNNDIEGVTVINACYGGISALLNSFNWLFSKYYDKKYAIVICGDIASYSKGPARPTGGAGTIGVLLGSGGCIFLEKIRASFMKNVYDFYKPNPISEYPTVDGHHSLDCYLDALYNCLYNYINKKGTINYKEDLFGFHCPYSKLVEKAFYQLKCFQIYYDYNNNINSSDNFYANKNISPEIKKELIENEGKFWKLPKNIQEGIKNIFQSEFKLKIEPGLFLCKQLGNLYTGSIFGFLISLLLNYSNKMQSLVGTRIFLFSYGSGLASSLLVLDIDNEKYKSIVNNNKDIFQRLKERIKLTPFLYESIMLKKEKLYLKNDYLTQGKIEDLFPGSFYLYQVDNLWKRYYKQKPYEEINNNIENKTIGNNSNNNTINKTKDNLIWSGFRKKNIIERQLQIKKIYDNVDIEKLKTGGLNLLRADNLIENCIGVISLPIGLGLNFIINGQKFSIPMSTEEPSVIAAASFAAKIIGENGGFFTNCDKAYMITQIMYEYDFSKIKNNEKDKMYYLSQISEIIQRNKKEIINYGNNNICNKMFIRGGGIIDIYIRPLKNNSSNFFSVELIVNCLEAMGANLLNEIAEKMSLYLLNQKYILQKPILRVLSNLCIYRKATSEFKIELSNLSTKNIDGKDLANLIIKANEIAKDDPFRASTHNKGIMNGIDAVAIALGQDFRAIEAGVHAYASIDPNNYNYANYRPLTEYEIVSINNKKFLYGKLTLPIAIGTVGGVINSNEAYENNMKILGKPNSEQLCQIMVSVGLAQNFAALRALVSEGIQRGHIHLHAKNIAYRAGTPDHLIGDVVNFMKNNGNINEETAKRYLESIQLYSKIRKNGKNKNENNMNKLNKLSNFFIDINFGFLKYPIKMNILINSKISPEINFGLLTTGVNNGDKRIHIINNDLFGQKQKSIWLYEFMTLVHNLDLFKNNLEEIYQIKYKVKLCVILFFQIINNLLKKDTNVEIISNFITEMLKEKYINGNFESLFNLIPNSTNDENISLEFGLTVILELYEIYLFYIDNYLTSKRLIMNMIKKEVIQSLNNFIKLREYKKNKKIKTLKDFEQYFELRLTRLNAIVLLLIDYGFSNEHYTENEINNFISLGRYAEIQITLYRDFSKVKNMSDNLLNSYKIFRDFLKNDMGINDDKLIQEKYFGIKSNEISKLIENIKRININGENGLSIKEKIDRRIQIYYAKVNTNTIKL